MTAKSEEVPVIGRPGQAVVLPEMKGTDAVRKAKEGIQNLNSGRIKIESKKLYNSVILSTELQKYSVVELDALLVGRIKAGMLLSMADAIINGDTETGTGNVNHKGEAITAVANYESKAKFNFDKGLRKVALAGAGATSIDIGVVEGANDIFKLQALITSTSDPAQKIILMDQANLL